MKILLVDDDLDTINILKEIISISFPTAGIDSARNGIEALEKIQNASIKEKPSIIITDLSMPGMNGVELCKCVKAKDDHVKIALLSAFESKEPSFDVIFSKPVDIKRFLDFINANVNDSKVANS